MDEAIQSLAHLPERCKLAPENCSVPFKMWQLLYGHRPHLYRILFTIDGDPCMFCGFATADANILRHIHEK